MVQFSKLLNQYEKILSFYGSFTIWYISNVLVFIYRLKKRHLILCGIAAFKRTNFIKVQMSKNHS